MASENKAAEQFNAFLDTKYIPLDNKIKLVIFIVILVLPIVLYYFLAYTKNIKQIDNHPLSRVQKVPTGKRWKYYSMDCLSGEPFLMQGFQWRKVFLPEKAAPAAASTRKPFC